MDKQSVSLWASIVICRRLAKKLLACSACCPLALAAAREVCSRVIALDMSEFVKMDGGLTCLSLRY